MKEQFIQVILPPLPIVGQLCLKSRDGKTIAEISVVKKQKPSTLNSFFESCYIELERFLSGKTKNLDLPLDFTGLTKFQCAVLKEMKKIPYGQVRTYKEIANSLNTRGYQAIGSACGKNPFMLIYPCHRVLGSQGPGGFAHGLPMKRSLLNLEGQKLLT
jgi:O-6-methylguanine DNA methyltransferase